MHLGKSREKITTWSECIVHTDLDLHDRLMLNYDSKVLLTDGVQCKQMVKERVLF